MTPKFNINNSKLSGIDKERNSEMELKQLQENKSEVANYGKFNTIRQNQRSNPKVGGMSILQKSNLAL